MRILFALLCFAAVFAAPRADAAEPGPLQACLEETEGDFDAVRACIGRISTPCLNDDDGSVSTVGMITCYQREREQWTELRAQFTAALQAQESPTQRAQLGAMLREYESWSNARCSYGASIYEGGSLSRVVAAACVNRLEGELAIDLWLRVREYSQR